jgi:hypothetical protein
MRGKVVSSLHGCTPTGAGVVLVGSLRRRGGGRGRAAVAGRWLAPSTDARRRVREWCADGCGSGGCWIAAAEVGERNEQPWRRGGRLH